MWHDRSSVSVDDIMQPHKAEWVVHLAADRLVDDTDRTWITKLIILKLGDTFHMKPKLVRFYLNGWMEFGVKATVPSKKRLASGGLKSHQRPGLWGQAERCNVSMCPSLPLCFTDPKLEGVGVDVLMQDPIAMGGLKEASRTAIRLWNVRKMLTTAFVTALVVAGAGPVCPPPDW